MAAAERITVTLPAEAVREIDRVEKNRSRFIAEAVQRELERRRRAELRRSLNTPHSETEELEELGLGDWASRLPDGDGVVDPGGGTPVRWIPGEGWLEGDK